MRNKVTKYLKKPVEQVLNWANQFNYLLLLNGEYEGNYPSGHFPQHLFASNTAYSVDDKTPFKTIDQILNEHNKPLYGFLSYDLKNYTEKLRSNNIEIIKWPLAGLFHADIEVIIYSDYIEIIAEDHLLNHYAEDFDDFQKSSPIDRNQKTELKEITASTAKNDYLSTVQKLQQHIVEGDIYEINYCINFDVAAKNFNPIEAYLKLSTHSPNPFGCYLKWDTSHVLCASPERFLKADDNKLISQPIKGTARRSADKSDDFQIKQELYNSIKERAENMMIVDLVRNDLARSAISGSVKVDEMFGIYSFPQVHQMISTISAIKRNDLSLVSTIKNAFPMGSMTGAPKIRAMELIERYETHKRGIFSGSIGMLSKDSCDLNVVIRSLFYNETSKAIHYNVGSAITYDSIAENEYEECLLKANAIKAILADKD